MRQHYCKCQAALGACGVALVVPLAMTPAQAEASSDQIGMAEPYDVLVVGKRRAFVTAVLMKPLPPSWHLVTPMGSVLTCGILHRHRVIRALFLAPDGDPDGI